MRAACPSRTSVQSPRKQAKTQTLGDIPGNDVDAMSTKPQKTVTKVIMFGMFLTSIERSISMARLLLSPDATTLARQCV